MPPVIEATVLASNLARHMRAIGAPCRRVADAFTRLEEGGEDW
jgi:hypothetical protein